MKTKIDVQNCQRSIINGNGIGKYGGRQQPDEVVRIGWLIWEFLLKYIQMWADIFTNWLIKKGIIWYFKMK
jgi:hypothetical protein